MTCIGEQAQWSFRVAKLPKPPYYILEFTKIIFSIYFQVSIWDLPEILSWLLGYHDLGAKHGRETLIQNAKKHCTGIWDGFLFDLSSHTNLYNMLD